MFHPEVKLWNSLSALCCETLASWCWPRRDRQGCGLGPVGLTPAGHLEGSGMESEGRRGLSAAGEGDGAEVLQLSCS